MPVGVNNIALHEKILRILERSSLFTLQESFRPPKTVHCSTCQVCVANYDQHCPWTGKCIGVGNLRLFQFFVIFIIFNITYC